MADRLADRRQVVAGRLELLRHRADGEGHVGARVPIGHRVDVELVDPGLVGVERGAVAHHHGAQLLGAEAGQRHRRAHY